MFWFLSWIIKDWINIFDILNIHVCIVCKDHLYEAYEFREMCLRSEFMRTGIKIEEIKVEKEDADVDVDADDDFTADTTSKPLTQELNALYYTEVCSVCSNFTQNLYKINENIPDTTLSFISQLKCCVPDIVSTFFL